MDHMIGKFSESFLKIKWIRFFVSGLAKPRYVIAALKYIMPARSGKTILGVEITASNIYLSRISKHKVSPGLSGLASAVIEGNFLYEDISGNPGLYSDNLRNLLNDNNIKTKKAAILLPTSSSIIKFVTIPRMNAGKIKNDINSGTLWQEIMGKHPRDDYSISYHTTRKNSFSGTMDIILIATRIKDIELYRNIAINAGLKQVTLDAKILALYYAFQSQIHKNTIIIELGLNDNFVMVTSDEGPHIFEMPVTENERAAMLGDRSINDENLINNLINNYQQKVAAIITSYKTIRPEVTLKDIFVISSLPFITKLINKLNYSLGAYSIKECRMFDYISIPHNFSISKDSERNNISAWSGALCVAVSALKNHQREWVEIKKPEIIKPAISLDLPGNIQNSIPLRKQPVLLNIVVVIAAIITTFAIYISYMDLEKEQQQLANSSVVLNEMTVKYNQKSAEIASLQNIIEELDYIKEQGKLIAKDNNQFYVISIYNYFDTILEHGVWMKQMTFTAPNDIEIEGRSLDGSNVVEFLGTLNDSMMFSTIDLKHMQTLNEMDLYRKKPLSLKSFILKGKLADTLPSDYLNKAGLKGKDIIRGN